MKITIDRKNDSICISVIDYDDREHANTELSNCVSKSLGAWWSCDVRALGSGELLGVLRYKKRDYDPSAAIESLINQFSNDGHIVTNRACHAQ